MTLVAAPIKIFTYFFLSSIFTCTLLLAEDPSSIESGFTPPKNWIQADASLLHSRVKIGFFSKTTDGFNPSINLTEEKTSLSPNDYLKAVQKIHESNPKSRWRKLGTIQTLSGAAFLTAIDIENPVGKIRILQSLLIKEGVAYILTSSTLKEQCQKHQKEILDAFKSLSLTKKPLVDLSEKNS